MAVSSTPVSEHESLPNPEVRVQGSKNKVAKKCSNLPQGHTSPSLAPALEKKKTGKGPGVRVVGRSIYDSQNGKNCHQCRQKKMDIMVSCKNQKKGKQCSSRYCNKCILNRYGEKAEEVAALKAWFCPKCRGICNCSLCRKKSGQQPTGKLVHNAKSSSFSSVPEMLIVNGSDVQSVKTKKGKDNVFSENMNHDEEKTKAVKEGSVMDHEIIHKKRKRKTNKEEGKHEDVPGAKKIDRHGGKSKITMQRGQVETNSFGSLSDVEISLPQGSELRTVADIEFQPEEVGHALQFLEFCAAFQVILDIKKDEPEYILHELMRGGSGCIGRSSPVAQFLVRMLLLIEADLGESSPVITHRLSHNTSWLLALHKCISRSTFLSGKLKLDKFDGEVDTYNSLNSTERLTLLNFVCDEVLCTNKVRNWMDEQQLKCNEKVKETKEKIVAAKQKEKQLKQKMNSELAEAVIAKNGVPLSVSEYETIVSEFKVQKAQAHAEMLESKGMLHSEKQHCFSVRTKPVLMDNDGRTFWRLKGCGGESDILLQKTSLPNESESNEKWFTYEEEEQRHKVNKYITFKEKGKRSCSISAIRCEKI